jgi:uncharacterized protein GlcG (DUF336 family)
MQMRKVISGRFAAGALGALVLAGGVALAAGNPFFHDAPASPRSLPADNLPPFNMLDEHGALTPMPPIPAGALHRGPGAPPESTARGPGLALATRAAQTAVAACGKAGYRIGVAVIDSVGEARALLTADGSDGSHVFVAMRKAITALEFKATSAQALERVQSDASLLKRVTPAMFVEGGAVPIIVRGDVIGAIGASGAAGEPIGHQDELCAQAGADSVRALLEHGAR